VGTPFHRNICNPKQTATAFGTLGWIHSLKKRPGISPGKRSPAKVVRGIGEYPLEKYVRANAPAGEDDAEIDLLPIEADGQHVVTVTLDRGTDSGAEANTCRVELRASHN
jgi:hypothetical protein